MAYGKPRPKGARPGGHKQPRQPKFPKAGDPELKFETAGAVIPVTPCPQDKDEIKSEICTRIASGQSIEAIGRMEGWPSRPTIWLWRKSDANFAAGVTEANLARAEYLIDRIQEIAEDQSRDVDSEGRPNYTSVARDKLRVDTLKGVAAMLDRQRYGDQTRTTVVGDSRAPVYIAPMPPNQVEAEMERIISECEEEMGLPAIPGATRADRVSALLLSNEPLSTEMFALVQKHGKHGKWNGGNG
jgi:hypothetical protein